MKLISARIENFRSIEDSDTFEIGDLTCLVGKNEAGKTAILQALLGLNPFYSYSYNKSRDYPRRFLTKFDERHADDDGASLVAYTTWSLDENDIKCIEKEFGPKAIKDKKVTISSYIGSSDNVWDVYSHFDIEECIYFLINQFKLTTEDLNGLDCSASINLAKSLELLPQRNEQQNALLAKIKSFRENSISSRIVDILQECLPKFFYTSHFERMSGEISVDKLIDDEKNKKVSVGDKIFLDFLSYAGTSIEELRDIKKHEELKALCEGASNEITDEIFEFWSQNDALNVEIDFSLGKPEDAPPFDKGSIIKIRIYNNNHRVSVPLSERSAGFVWFFSFLSQFKQLKKEAGNAILLLDEPGLTLHGKAQADLLRFMQERLLPEHQIIYTTHSPFMIPNDRFEDIRVVEDIVEKGGRRPIIKGTKISSEILSVDKDTLFPLQSHLGYEITQTLFVGQNTLLVEGPSDILYLKVVSNILKKKEREGLSSKWTICPTGGIDKIFSFASLFSGNRLNIAVLSDFSKGDKSKIERLKQSQILRTNQIFTTSDFTGKNESDIEDLFSPRLYIEIVNNSFNLKGKNKLKFSDVPSDDIENLRIVKWVESAFNLLPTDIPEFDHYTPADHLLRTPQLMDEDSKEVEETLSKFEKIFKEFNKLIVLNNEGK